MTSPGNHILPHYDAALNAIRLRVNAICGSLLKYMDILEQVISGPDSDGDRKSTRLNSSHKTESRMPSSA